MKYLFSLLFMLSLIVSINGQDDDFFLNDPEENTGAADEATIFDATDDLSTYYDDIVPRQLMTESRVIEYEPLRESDVMWQRRIWRVVDTREKMNMGFRNADRPFFTILKDLAESGDIKVFRDEKFKEPMSNDDLSKMMNRIDT